MRSSTTILVQKKPHQSHHEVKVIIDWAGVSRQDLEILARNALLYDLQFNLRRSESPLPEEVVIDVRSVVQREMPCLTQFNPPPPKPSKKVQELLEALKGLSPEEQAALFTS
jgi:hypothetical protein